jgi:hypothetical protein
MINARKPSPLFGILIALLLSAAFVAPAAASTTCQPGPQGQVCVSQVDFNRFAQTAFRTQDQSQWCWAASISMLFSYYGHPVSQERIVEAVYGRRVNLPSGPGWNIAGQVNRDWQDDQGRVFHSRLTAAYDFDARVNAVDNNWLVNELDQDRPFIIGTAGHAVVVTAIQFVSTAMGPNVIAVGVFDPWPGRGARGLSPAEMTQMHVNPSGLLRFIATVKVSDD